jgi:quercetin dioxygenase-like cupin family protein
MRVVQVDNSKLRPAQAPIFLGSVDTDAFLDGVSEHVRLTTVRFAPGARTKLHTHAFEQVLIITEGRGIVATRSEQFEVTPGAVVVIPPGEPHTHGGAGDSAMTHISITTPGETKLLE